MKANSKIEAADQTFRPLRRRCPEFGERFEGCYGTNLTSTNIDLMLRYCADQYEKCPLYLERLRPEMAGL